jgi:phage-related protein
VRADRARRRQLMTAMVWNARSKPEYSTNSEDPGCRQVPELIRSPRHERPPRRIPALFFRLESGREPVREWLRAPSMSKLDRFRVGEAVRVVQRQWPIGMPLCRSLGSGLWGIRIHLADRSARVMFCFHEGSIVLLHAFVKKTQSTSGRDLQLARQRKEEIESVPCEPKQ